MSTSARRNTGHSLRSGLDSLFSPPRTAGLRDFPWRKCAGLAGLGMGEVAGCVGLAVGVAIADAFMLALLVPLARVASDSGYGAFWRLGVVARLLPQPSDFAAAFLCLAGLMFAAALVKNGFALAQHTLMGRLRTDIAHRLGDAMFSRYLKFGKAWFDRTGIGQMTTLLDYRHDVVAVFQACVRVTSCGLLLCGYLAVMLLISWKLTLTALLVLPIVYLSSRAILNRIHAAARRIKDTVLRMGQHAHETLSMLPVFQGAGREDQALSIFSEHGELLRRSSRKAWQLQGISARIQELTALLSLLLMLGLAFRLEPERAGQPAVILAFFFIARLSLPMLSVFPESLLDVSERLPKCRALLTVFDDDGKYIVTGGDREFRALRDAIRFDRATFSYPEDITVLNEVSFEAGRGRMTAIVGPTGAGKSTMFNILMRFYDIAPGTVFLDDVDIRDYSIESLRRNVAFVSQDTMVLSGSLRSNLLFGVERAIPEAEMNRAIEDARLGELVTALPGGLDGVIGELGGTLSGGQRQRIAIARALLRRTSVILLDEATTGLDAITEELVREAIVNAVRRSTTVLVIAHRFATIQYADQVVVLDAGRVAEQGTIGKLLACDGLFRRLWAHQQIA